MIDHIDLLREQLKILSGEVALHSSALKRLSEEAANNPKKEQIQVMSWLLNLPRHYSWENKYKACSAEIKFFQSRYQFNKLFIEWDPAVDGNEPKISKSGLIGTFLLMPNNRIYGAMTQSFFFQLLQKWIF